eukprot:280908_1
MPNELKILLLDNKKKKKQKSDLIKLQQQQQQIEDDDDDNKQLSFENVDAPKWFIKTFENRKDDKNNDDKHIDLDLHKNEKDEINNWLENDEDDVDVEE